MKRKRCKQDSLFFWNDRSKMFDGDAKRHQRTPQLDLLVKPTTNYHDCYPLPYELMVKIFKAVIDISKDPIKDLFNLSMVCEGWRQMILNEPNLWHRLELVNIPKTDGNFRILRKVYHGLPTKYQAVKSFHISGQLSFKDPHSITLIENVLDNGKLEKLTINEVRSENRAPMSVFSKGLVKCQHLKHLNITSSIAMFNNQKWLVDFLTIQGQAIETLNLAMSLTSISSQLIRSVWSDNCPKLKYLDLSTCDALTTHSFDAIQLSQNLPCLEVLRLGNVSFKRVHEPPTRPGLIHLRELSIPIGLRDAERDDALFATLAFGSNSVRTLDLRGSTISANALIDMPSNSVTELHMDDLCPITRKQYHKIIEKWAHSLETLSLVKINCSETLDRCLRALNRSKEPSKLKELDLSSSDVTGPDLSKFLKQSKSLETINLSSCRSLPRGCKAVYSRDPNKKTAHRLQDLYKRLAN